MKSPSGPLARGVAFIWSSVSDRDCQALERSFPNDEADDACRSSCGVAGSVNEKRPSPFDALRARPSSAALYMDTSNEPWPRDPFE